MSNPDNSGSDQNIDWRAARRAERKARRAARRGGDAGHYEHGGPGIGGLILVVIGAVLLVGQFGFHLPERWWAALLLIPAGGALVSAVRFLRIDEHFSRRVIGPLVIGLVFLGLACAFLLRSQSKFFLACPADPRRPQYPRPRLLAALSGSFPIASPLRERRTPSVIPAQAGIQTEVSGNPKRRLDSRLRGNDSG